jgi:hypothetical protein
VLQGLGRRRRQLRGLPGPHQGRQRLSLVTGTLPVIGKLGQLDRGTPGVGVAAPDPAVQGPGVGGVQGRALHGQQFAVDRLLHQRVPEHVAAVSLVDRQQMTGDRLAQQRHELPAVPPGRRGQQLVVHP